MNCYLIIQTKNIFCKNEGNKPTFIYLSNLVHIIYLEHSFSKRVPGWKFSREYLKKIQYSFPNISSSPNLILLLCTLMSLIINGYFKVVSSKGQLIWKGLSGFFNSSKKRMKNFCPSSSVRPKPLFWFRSDTETET